MSKQTCGLVIFLLNWHMDLRFLVALTRFPRLLTARRALFDTPWLVFAIALGIPQMRIKLELIQSTKGKPFVFADPIVAIVSLYGSSRLLERHHNRVVVVVVVQRNRARTRLLCCIRAVGAYRVAACYPPSSANMCARAFYSHTKKNAAPSTFVEVYFGLSL